MSQVTAASAVDVEPLRASLAPVRRALLDDASAEADALLARARSDADSTIGAARRETQVAVEQARERATAARAATTDMARREAQRQAHRRVLRARSEVWRELVDRVIAAVDELRDDPRYPELVAHLTALARDQLGPDATIDEHPDGGIVARAGTRRVDYGLPALARRALIAIAGEEDGPWR